VTELVARLGAQPPPPPPSRLAEALAAERAAGEALRRRCAGLEAQLREAQAGGPASTAALRASVAGLREQQDALRQAVILLKAAVGPALASAAACASRLQRTAAREH